MCGSLEDAFIPRSPIVPHKGKIKKSSPHAIKKPSARIGFLFLIHRSIIALQDHIEFSQQSISRSIISYKKQISIKKHYARLYRLYAYRASKQTSAKKQNTVKTPIFTHFHPPLLYKISILYNWITGDKYRKNGNFLSPL